MTMLRRHVRLWALAWFLCQATALSALVPRDCCAHHRPTPRAASSCHEAPAEPPPDAFCPMHARRTPDTHGDGHAVASSRPATSATPPATSPMPAPLSRDACVMRGTCDGPPLFTLFSHTGVLPDVDVRLVVPSRATRPVEMIATSLSRPAPPPLRPPRHLPTFTTL